jgi:hypothetical protein
MTPSNAITLPDLGSFRYLLPDGSEHADQIALNDIARGSHPFRDLPHLYYCFVAHCYILL